jgi:hypothetical protein
MPPKNLVIELFMQVESGELANFNPEKLIASIIRFASSNEKGEYQAENYKDRLKTFRTGLMDLFKKLDVMIDSAEGTVDKIVSFQRKRMKKLETLPKYALIEDNEKIIEFIRKLNKDFYNFSSAEKLVGVTRQTLKKKIDEGFLDIKLVYLNKAPLISQQDLIRIYRHYNETDTWGF